MLKRLKRAIALAVGTSLVAASLIACDTVGPNAVVATVNGEKIYRWELDKYYNDTKDLVEETNGIEDLDAREYSEQRLEVREKALETLIDDTIITLAAKDEGYALTAEEIAQVDAQFQQMRDAAIADYKKNYEGDADADKKAEADWKALLEEQHLTEQFVRESMYNAQIRQKYGAEIFKDTEPTEEEIVAKYEELVDADKTKFTENPSAYEDAAAVPGGVYFYNPPGYMRVKQIMFSLPEEIDQQIRDIADQWGRAILESDSLTQEKGKDDPAVSKLQVEMMGYDEQTKALYKEGYAAIKPQADACAAELKAGASFEDMIAKYNDDPGMTMMPISEYGYLVGPTSAANGMLKGFVDAALALEKAGDVSDPVESIEGMHIIKLLETIEEGPVPLEDCRDNVVAFLVGSPRVIQLEEIAREKRAELDSNGKPKFEIKRHIDRIG